MDIVFEIFKQVDLQRPVIFTTAYDDYAIDAFCGISALIIFSNR